MHTDRTVKLATYCALAHAVARPGQQLFARSESWFRVRRYEDMWIIDIIVARFGPILGFLQS